MQKIYFDLHYSCTENLISIFIVSFVVLLLEKKIINDESFIQNVVLLLIFQFK